VKILVLNSGSSSQKTSLYDFGASLPDSPPTPLWEGKLEWQGEHAILEIKNSAGIIQKEEMTATAR
jgi:acetate kinase